MLYDIGIKFALNKNPSLFNNITVLITELPLWNT